MATTKVGALKLRPAARYLGGLSMPTMYRLVQRKHLGPVRVLGIYLFPLTGIGLEYIAPTPAKAEKTTQQGANTLMNIDPYSETIIARLFCDEIQCVFTIHPRKDHRGFNLVSDALPFGRLWDDGPDAVANAIGYAEHRIRSHHAVIRVYDDASNVIETHEHKGEFKE
jgi:hypothetical protein